MKIRDPLAHQCCSQVLQFEPQKTDHKSGAQIPLVFRRVLEQKGKFYPLLSLPSNHQQRETLHYTWPYCPHSVMVSMRCFYRNSYCCLT